MIDDHAGGGQSLGRVDLLLRDATVVDPDGLRTGVDIAIGDGRIEHVTATGTNLDRAVETVDCRSALVIPAYANIHHHFATGLLRGSPAPSVPTRTQKERLERVIWPFAQRLTQDDVRIAVRASLLEATAAGTGTIIDHHVSGSCIPGVLDVIAEEVVASGLRGILCYEVTDRDGPAIAAAGLAETKRFLRALPSADQQLAGMVGLHAMSTVGPETLDRAVTLAGECAAGLHLHVGEAAHDNDDSVVRFGARPVARLAAAGALTSRTLAAHAIHVTEEEARILGERQVLIAHNPRSNASNGVGLTDLSRLAAAGCTIGVGGDGFTQDIRGDVALIAPLQRLERRDPTVFSPREVVAVGVEGNAEMVQRLSGWRIGRIAAGFLADLLILEYEPVVPLMPQNALWHIAAGFPGATVRTMWVGGVPVLRDGCFVRLDAERIRAETARWYRRN
jgi:cytosine/adenosine deaminase-related metal-dependent hydrolase